ncbi:TonB family protein [Geofilum sp. OHC36d9]|uniref:TonB family protein n=1 Tax=Geofilum sp. OHC36d9 TaxID=3458413 RepID=UPI004033C6F2
MKTAILIHSFIGIRRFKWIVYWILFSVSSVVFVQAQSNGNDTTNVYDKVDKLPKFKGKPANVTKFVDQHIVYPDEAWRKQIEGVVVVQGVVAKDGSLLNLSIKESVDPLLDMEALRVVEMMTTWKPAQVNGANVNCNVVIPVRFSLSPAEREFVQTMKKYGLDINPPLYVLDDKVVMSRVHIPSYNIKSIRVLKGDDAVKRFGEEAKNGVVIIESKRGTPPVR